MVGVGLLNSVLRVPLVIMVGSRWSSMRVEGLLWALQVDGDGGGDVRDDVQDRGGHGCAQSLTLELGCERCS